jgi:opacity protein-like surface antigen
MKSLKLLALLTVIGAAGANAHGFYIGGGYGQGTPKMSVEQGAFGAADLVDGAVVVDSAGNPIFKDGASDTGGTDDLYVTWPIYPDYDTLFGEAWPAYYDPDADQIVVYYEDGAWNMSDALVEKKTMKADAATSMIVFAGWDFARSPFRIEGEVSDTKFAANKFDMSIKGVTPYGDQVDFAFNDIPTGFSCPGDVDDAGLCVSPSTIGTDVKLRTMMVNMLFEIPGFENIDPYVGVGVGVANLTLSGGLEGSVKGYRAMQYIAGIEYKIPETGWIVGAEYRMFSMKKGGEDSNDKVETYIDEAYIDLDYNSIALKVRYDFVSEDF